MNLTALLNSIDYEITCDAEDKDVKELIYHSDKAGPGTVFFAIDGENSAGAKYIPQAVDAGCDIIVTSQNQDNMTGHGALTQIKVKDVREAMSAAAASFYGNPSDKLLTIGVTGTKGKTGTAHMIWRILEEAGIKTGIIGTVYTGFGDNIELSERTTPQSVDLQRTLRQQADAGCKAVVIEVSSQGLKHKRVMHVDFDVCVFTNISPDHISAAEHRDYEEYRYWKSRLFRNCRLAVMNADDPEYSFMLKGASPERILLFGKSDKADFCINSMNCIRREGKLGMICELEAKKPCGDNKSHRILLNMPGEFNAYNSVAAVSVTRALGIPWGIITETLAEIRIPGRTEIMDVSKEFCVMVDYAHNGVALANLLSELKKYEPKHLIVVFGCGGDRDKNRRAEMGRAASRWADVIIITSDNPRSEQPQAIIEDINRAVAGSAEVLSIADRREAIRTALDKASCGDIVVVAGKGHETYQIIGDQTLHFDDRDEIMSFGKETR